MANQDMPLAKLNDGHDIPMIAFGSGTAWTANKSSSNEKALIATQTLALKLGYHHVDAAEIYGNEAAVGHAIKASSIPRGKLFITSKVFSGLSDIPAACTASLKKLGVEYLDLYLIHTPFSAAVAEPQALQRAWAAMEALQAAGKVRSIGVSNFHAPHLATILETAKVKPAINQVEFHPYLQHKALQSLLHEHGIVLAAYGPLTAVTKAAPGPVDEILQRLARKYNVTAGEICLRWCVEQGVVAVTTSSKEDRLRQYLKATAFRMTPREVAEISEAGEGKHYRGFFTDKFAADDRS